ncbi:MULTISPECIES: glutamine-hydrolyzing carbamoyl-phosphate synthase small subunit [Euryhalocaulis]|uniref:glutamine-hydrolyzing carbamoyl-phosphate synthase small subunit n=1 Tax=Euryhalocaulis TaxID=1712422 RepID=UPI0003A12C16|nr:MULTISPECIES: glutamine-hydrolyzing carbamoyl-phosphate synthase small subunit [Euryhalocaulis]MBA4800633.1 glutamine-hydrolyzing carbamoyl-phosphate synthase small subunit [Euryhalocaulis sp.]
MVEASANQGATAILALADGSVFFGRGAGATGEAAGELCFNTAMTGQQEILTDPSYTGQIVCFTFPHVGNVGANPDDMETGRKDAALGAVMRADITRAANWRAAQDFDDWMESRGIVGVTGVDTRAITKRIRENGMPHAIVAHDPDGQFDVPALIEKAKAFAGLEGADLASAVTTEESYGSTEARWDWPDGFPQTADDALHVVVMDFGTKKNILRSLGASGLKATVVPAKTTADEILALKPDGVMLSNGPGDPAATAEYAAPVIRDIIAAGVPVLGVCLGHQLLALAAGAKTVKMEQGHHGANHPVKDLTTGKVEIVSMNHGFAVDRDTLPDSLEETHVSLFDGTNCGLRFKDAPVFAVQHHPEASPGPQDSFYLFDRFADAMRERRA